MKIEIKVFTKLGMNWKGTIEYKEENIKNGEVLIFPQELEKEFTNNVLDSVSIVLTHKPFQINATFTLRQLSHNVWIETEPPEFTWNRFKRELESLLRKYLTENHLIKTDVS